MQRLLREENVLRWDPNDRCASVSITSNPSPARLLVAYLQALCFFTRAENRCAPLHLQMRNGVEKQNGKAACVDGKVLIGGHLPTGVT